MIIWMVDRFKLILSISMFPRLKRKIKRIISKIDVNISMTPLVVTTNTSGLESNTLQWIGEIDNEIVTN